MSKYRKFVYNQKRESKIRKLTKGTILILHNNKNTNLRVMFGESIFQQTVIIAIDTN
jgi:hypothetical protein